MASETWSQILSGWPSPTDSDVNRKWPSAKNLVSQKARRFGKHIAPGVKRNDLILGARMRKNEHEIDNEKFANATLHKRGFFLSTLLCDPSLNRTC